ncbi:MAG: NUDIX domain-containing protein [Chloroflexi bacterium]|nr:NUDIX domain-containing protein [Chloroflexota bacterium]
MRTSRVITSLMASAALSPLLALPLNKDRWITWGSEVLHLLAGWVLRVVQVLTLGQLPPVVGVGGVVLREGEVLALHRSDGRYALPGGAMRYGETCDAALRRELREETGAEIAIEGLVGVYSGPAPGRNVRAVVIVYRCRWTGGQERCSYEGEPVWLSLEALPPPEQWAFGSDDVLADLRAGRLNLY